MNIIIKNGNNVKEIMELLTCCAILYNLMIDVDDSIPNEWYESLDSGHYWIDDTGGEPIFMNNECADRRLSVFHALIEDYYT